MNYEIVHLPEQTVVGIAARTNNTSPDTGAVIGGLWNRFYGEGIYNTIPHQTTGKALGIYTDYAGDEKADYTLLVSYAVSKAEENTALVVRKIPAGRYAKFVVCGNMHTVVAEAWQKIWTLNLPRSFVCDFEEYQNADMENAEIHIYIGLKEGEDKE